MRRLIILISYIFIIFVVQITPKIGMAQPGWEKSQLAELSGEGFKKLKGDIGPDATEAIDKAMAEIDAAMIDLNKLMIHPYRYGGAERWQARTSRLYGKWDAYIDTSKSAMKKHAPNTGISYEQLISIYWNAVLNDYSRLVVMLDSAGYDAMAFRKELDEATNDLNNATDHMEWATDDKKELERDMEKDFDEIKKVIERNRQNFDFEESETLRQQFIATYSNSSLAILREANEIDDMFNTPYNFEGRWQRIENNFDESYFNERLVSVDIKIKKQILKWGEIYENEIMYFIENHNKFNNKYAKFIRTANELSESYKNHIKIIDSLQ